MKQLQFIILFVFSILFHASGQNNGIDTVFVKKSLGDNEFEIDTMFTQSGMYPKVLVGTTFLPYSEKIIGILNKGLFPISVSVKNECDMHDIKEMSSYPKFESITRELDILTIEVTIFYNCYYNFLGEAEVIGQDTLNLIYTAYGAFCSCDCLYTLEYKFNTASEENYQILKYVTINGSEVVGRIPSKP